MRLPWNKSGDLQLDLLEGLAAPDAAATTTATVEEGAAASAGLPLMVATSSLHEDPHNPRTEFPQADLDELAQDIRQYGILQPIVVHPQDAEGRHQIHFGAKRWRAAQTIGLREVPVVVRQGPANPYAQVAENQKRHGLTPLDLARFIRGRIEAGDTNSDVARGLGLDLTTVAHHLALLNLPPVVEAAMKSGRCSSPRTLYELSKLHAEQPERVAEMVAGTGPITRDAVAEVRDNLPAARGVPGRAPPKSTRPDSAAQTLSRATGLCDQLDAALTRLAQLGKADVAALPAPEFAALRQRLALLACRLDG